VLAARHAFAALDTHAADRVVRLPRHLVPLARIHRRPPSSPVFDSATAAPRRPGFRARCAIGFLPWVRAFPPPVAVRSWLDGARPDASQGAATRATARPAPHPGGDWNVAEFIRDVKRTHSCGELTARETGREVVLFGWVHNRRDHGGAVFIDLRDRAGLTQVV